MSKPDFGMCLQGGEKQGKVQKLSKGEVLMLNIGSMCTGARVIAVSPAFICSGCFNVTNCMYSHVVILGGEQCSCKPQQASCIKAMSHKRRLAVVILMQPQCLCKWRMLEVR